MIIKARGARALASYKAGLTGFYDLPKYMTKKETAELLDKILP